MPMPSAISVCVLFISLMQLVNGAQFFIIIIFLLFAAAPAPAVYGTIILHSEVYMHHYN